MKIKQTIARAIITFWALVLILVVGALAFEFFHTLFTSPRETIIPVMVITLVPAFVSFLWACDNCD